MDPRELEGLLVQSAEHVQALTEAAVAWDTLLEDASEMKANEDAQIYHHLYTCFTSVLDPSVYAAAMTDPQGYRRTFRIGRRQLAVSVIHREPKLERINGVDVIYQLGNEKALAFQHKKRSKSGSLSLRREELDQKEKLANLCRACKVPRTRKEKAPYIRPHCASVYVIGDHRTPARHVVSACGLGDYQDDYGNLFKTPYALFPRPSDLNTVDSMFLQCTIGRRLRKDTDRHDIDSIRDAFLTAPDIVINANLRDG